MVTTLQVTPQRGNPYLQKETGYLDRKKSASARDKAKGGGR